MKLRRPYPRRSRRGFAALTLVMIVSAVLTAMTLSWQAGLARDRLTGQADILAQAVAAEGYALHHWLHAEQGQAGFSPPSPGTVQELSEPELDRLQGHGASASWRALPRGWTVTRLIAAPESAVGATARPHGIVVLTPPPDLETTPIWPALRAALDIQLGHAPHADAAEALAAVAPGDFRPGRDIAVFAWPHARVDPDAVLRMDRAGYPRPIMETDIGMGGNTLGNVGQLGADTARFPLLPMITLSGELFASNGLDVAGDSTLQALAAGTATVVRALTTPRIEAGWASIRDVVKMDATYGAVNLVACKTPANDRCNGGDLDLTAAAGPPKWTEVIIFGDARTQTATVAGETRAGLTVFDTIPGYPRLNVGDVFNCATCPWMFH